MLYNSFSEEKWERVKTDEYYAPAVKATIAEAEKMLATAPAVIKYSDLHLFVETGDGATYQNALANNRSRVYTFFAAYMLTEDEKYLDALSDAIWTVCGIESWALPAHVSETVPMDHRRRFVDIASANLGRKLPSIPTWVRVF